MNDRDARDQHFDSRAAARDVAVAEGFEPAFGPEVEAALAAASARASSALAQGDAGALDLRGLAWSSIDNLESRDLDQIEVAEALEDGRTRVLVAIADVDSLVTRGDAIDAHAGRNTTSVYTAAAVFPMLPEALSTGLTSLLEDQERWAIVTEFFVDGEGDVQDGAVTRARVVNRAKLAYEPVAAWLEGRGPAPERAASSPEIAAQLRLQDAAAQRLRARRIARGALELDTTEARAVTSGDAVVDLRVVERSRSRELIEEIMVAANGVVARWLDHHGRSGIRRVVKTPKRWDRIVALAATFGATLPDAPDPRALSRFLADRRAADPDRMPDLSLAVVKLLGPGEYSLDRPGDSEGHFGLAASDYAHSTAPNRRFADLVTQRVIKATLRGDADGAGAPPYDDAALAAIALRCTEREHAAQKVERTTRKMAAALFLSRHIGETYDAIVTGATPKGTFARLLTPPAEGRIVTGERGLDVGDRLRVRLLATEPSRGFIDFARA